MTTETRIDLRSVAREHADRLGLPPIGGTDPIYQLSPPGGVTRLELASYPGLAEALLEELAEHIRGGHLLESGRSPTTIYPGETGVSYDLSPRPAYSDHGHLCWYESKIVGRAFRRIGR
jgi:hypothetical protein